MNKIWLFFLFIVFCNLQLKAQKFIFGVKGGLGMSNMVNTSGPDSLERSTPYNISPAMNLYLSYQSKSYCGITIEPGFIKKGYCESAPEHKPRINVNYLQLPVLADFYLANKWSVYAGPEANFLINAKYKYNHKKFDISDVYNQFELSAVTGINYNVLPYLDLGIRYSHGLTPSDEVHYMGNNLMERSIKQYNQYAQLTLKLKISGLINQHNASRP